MILVEIYISFHSQHCKFIRQQKVFLVFLSSIHTQQQSEVEFMNKVGENIFLIERQVIRANKTVFSAIKFLI